MHEWLTPELAELKSLISPGIKDATIAREFAMLERELPALIRSAMQKQDSEPAPQMCIRDRFK